MPTEAGTAVPAWGGVRPWVALPPPELPLLAEPPPPDDPQPAISTMADAAAKSAPPRVHILMPVPPVPE